MNLIYVVKGGIIEKIANIVIPVVVSSYTQQQAVAFSKLFFPRMSKILKSIIQYHPSHNHNKTKLVEKQF